MTTDIKPIKKPKDILHLGDIEVDHILQQVNNISEELWNAESKWRENDYKVFTHTQHIVFIFGKGKDHHEFNVKPMWKIWGPLFQPLIEKAIESYGYEEGVLCKAMLAKLKSKGTIASHVDYVIRDKYVHKIHIPLITNPQAIMQIGEEDFHLEKGKAYEVNNMVMHGVTNQGDEDRVHFIFEYYNKAKDAN